MRGVSWFGVSCLGLAAVVTLVALGGSPALPGAVSRASESWPVTIRANAATFPLPLGDVLDDAGVRLREQSRPLMLQEAAQAQAQTRATTVAPAPATASRTSQLLERTFASPALGRTMHYYVYLPAGYGAAGKRFAVLYLLHGRNTLGTNRGSDTEWVTAGVPQTADRLIAAGEMPPTIIVMPQGDAGYWMNHAGNGPRWGEYTAQDLVAHVDATYRTVPDAAHRAIGGLSMGGHGALQLAINYPGVFGVVGAHSPTLRTFAEAAADGDTFFGDAASFAARDPVALVQQYPERARALKIYLDVGKEDKEWREPTVALHELLAAQGVPHTFALLAGNHSKEYWRSHCAEYLRFYGANLAPALG